MELSEYFYTLPYGTSLSIETLLLGWRQHVERLRVEASQPNTINSWGVHDILAALHLRGHLYNALRTAPLEVVDAATSILSSADQDYKDFTDLDPSGRLRLLGEQPMRDDRWWWDRIPKAGPVRSEVLGGAGSREDRS